MSFAIKGRANERVVSLDQLDQAIIAALRSDPRSSNRSLCLALGVSEATIASRIAALRDLRVMDRVFQLDLGKLSLSQYAFLDIRTEGNPEEIAQELALINELISISVVAGSSTICAMTAVENMAALSRLIEEKVGLVSGICDVETTPMCTIYKYDSDNGGFSINSVKGEEGGEIWPHADELDRALVSMLRANANLSNREIARRAGVSEHTIRQRLKRIFEGGFARLSIVTDPSYFARSEASFVKIKTSVDQCIRLIDRLEQLEGCFFLGRAVGRWDLVMLLAVESRREIHDIIRYEADLNRSCYKYYEQEILSVHKHRVDLIISKHNQY